MEKIEKLTFEQAISRLEEVTRQLERSDIPLDESLRYFEEGTVLVRQCRELLKKAEQVVKLLTRTPDGELSLENFDVTDGQ